MGGRSAKDGKLYMFAKWNNDVWVCDPSEDDPINELSQIWPSCCTSDWGQDAIAYHAGTQRFFTAKNSNITAYSDDWTSSDPVEMTVKVDGTNLSDSEIYGFTFNGDIAYMAYKNSSNAGVIVRSQVAPETSSGSTRMIHITPTGGVIPISSPAAPRRPERFRTTRSAGCSHYWNGYWPPTPGPIRSGSMSVAARWAVQGPPLSALSLSTI